MYSYTYIVYPASFQPYIIVQGGKQMSSHRQSYLPALLALAVSAFAIGTTEFISVGLLPLISQDLHIPVTTAGLTVSMYALGVTFGAPVLTSLTSGMSRKTLLLWVMLIFIAGNTLAASASSIGILLAARVISAFSHGIFMSIGQQSPPISCRSIKEQARFPLCLRG